jgi:ectoine hydroxylase-related dioxygenase (phytanoyl-CoA dioxygenase family)
MAIPNYKLSTAQIERYNTDGYLIYGSLFEPDELSEVRDYICEKIVEKKVLPALHPHIEDKFLRQWCSQKRLLDLVEPLVGPNIVLWTVHCFHKEPKTGPRTPWHQDARYWIMEPIVTASIWLALEPVTVENGCMQVIPGTHTGQIYQHQRRLDVEHVRTGLNQEIIEGEIDLDRSVNIELRTGECSIHHSHIVHGANANESGLARNGLVLRYMPSSSKRKGDELYLARGVDLSDGYNVYMGDD